MFEYTVHVLGLRMAIDNWLQLIPTNFKSVRRLNCLQFKLLNYQQFNLLKYPAKFFLQLTEY